MKKVTLKNVALLFVVAYVVIAIWQDPAAMGDTVGNFFRATASWFGDLFDKISTFLSGLKS
jgi:hypothetical protein